MNHFRTFLLMSALVALCIFVGRLLGGPAGMILGFLLAVALNFGAYWFSDRMILAMHRAKEADPGEEPHLYRSIQKLSSAAGMPAPKVYIVETQAPNAFATGRGLNHAAVATTRGILDLLSPAELEAVLAHELAHIKNRDMLIGTIAATMAGAIIITADMARWAMLLGGYSSREQRGGNPLGFLLLVVLAPLAAILIKMAVSRSREYTADAGAAALISNPDSLAGALRKIQAAALGSPLEAASPATAHLYIVNPFDRETWLANLFSTHPSVGRRVKRLEEIREGKAKPAL